MRLGIIFINRIVLNYSGLDGGVFEETYFTKEPFLEGQEITKSAGRNPVFELFVASVLSLFVELLLIRYIAVEIHIFAYLKNLTLMACFFGLGLGFAWVHKKIDFFRWSATIYFGLVCILTISLALHWNSLTFVNPFQFMLFTLGGHTDTAPPLIESAKSIIIILIIFSATALVFVGMGQFIGKAFDRFTPLKAYSINVAGALTGSLLFSLLSSLETPPGVWIAISGLLFLLLRISPSNVVLVVFGIAHIFLVPHIAKTYYNADYMETLWSPYYRIDVVKSRAPGAKDKLWGYDLKVNYDTFQTILDCSPENLKKFPEIVQNEMIKSFTFPYDSLKVRPKKVLIIASGNGSDVAAALRSGAEHVDAVDIDPVITRLGKTLHPEKPYDDPRVSLYVTDARTYLKNCKTKYDFIVFAYLDSHTAFSNLSTLRTDNYIFTVDAYREAINLLNDRGVVFVSFVCFKDWLWDKQTNALREASGSVPVTSWRFNGVVGVGYMACGPGMQYLDASKFEMPGKPRAVNTSSGVPISTDDWPFLFLPSKTSGWSYALPLLIVIGLSSLTVMRELKAGLPERINWLLMLTGMGFMLLEVRAMADLSLVFGSTWFVNSAVISGVMVMILVGNFVASKLSDKHVVPVAVLLLVSLGVSIAFRASDLLVYGEVAGKILGTSVELLPAPLAAVLFALLFKRVKNPAEALAFNIFGGLLGVSLEYLSMQFGIRSLGFVCFAVYLAALALAAMKSKGEATSTSPSTSPLP